MSRTLGQLGHFMFSLNKYRYLKVSYFGVLVFSTSLKVGHLSKVGHLGQGSRTL